MIAIGIVLLIVGFVLIIPSGSLPGSVAVRNVRIGSSHIVKTPGHGDDQGRRRRWITVIAGFILFGFGLVLIALGS